VNGRASLQRSLPLGSRSSFQSTMCQVGVIFWHTTCSARCFVIVTRLQSNEFASQKRTHPQQKAALPCYQHRSAAYAASAHRCTAVRTSAHCCNASVPCMLYSCTAVLWLKHVLCLTRCWRAPGAFRDWGVELWDWQSQCSSTTEVDADGRRKLR
jgi:hypothetical protein